MEVNVVIAFNGTNLKNIKKCIHSFITTNHWFTGKIYISLIYPNAISINDLSDLTTLYQGVEVLSIPYDSVLCKAIKKNTEPDIINELFKLSACLLDPGPVLCLSDNLIFFNSIEEELKSNNFQIYSSPNLSSLHIVYFPAGLDSEKLSSFNRKFTKISTYLEEFYSIIAESFMTDQSNSVILTSSDYPDLKFIQKKRDFIYAKGIAFNTLSNNSKRYSRVNQLWLQQGKIVSNLLKRPSFRRGSTIKLNHVNEKTREPLISTFNHNDHPEARRGPVLPEKKDIKISVIIPAFKAANYIEECLDSIYSQSVKCEIEVLVGIDNCQSTLSAIKKIRKKYSNLKVFYSASSIGAYTMRNSLFEYSNHDAILFFDADDVLINTAVSTLLDSYSPHFPIRFKYINFNHGEKLNPYGTINPSVAHGVFFISKALFNRIGGFQNWVCGADTEFMKRCSSNKIHDLEITKPLFYRRIHENSLTQSAATGYRSKLRAEVASKIKSTRNWNIPITRHTAELIEIK